MQYLAGWDQMLPELGIKENILRSLFGVWQEYRGLGLYDGQSHAAELLHTLYVSFLSFILPQEYIRWILLLFLWIIGGVGMYFLLKRKIVGALFYLLNFATIQMFYTPFEAFAFHYAALPWLAYTLTNVLIKPTRRNYLIFLIITFLTTPQFYIPTLLIPIALLFFIIIIASGKHVQRLGLMAVIGFLTINAFWLLPFAYGIPKTAPIIMNAKINQMSSSEDLARNRAFSHPKDILLLRGFSLDFEDFDTNGTPIFLMESWRKYLNIPFVIGIQITIAGITLIGLFASLKKSNRLYLPYTILFIFSVFVLSSGIVQQYIPILGEALRFPFTKFSLLFAFSYSTLLVLGIKTISSVPAFELLIGVLLCIQAFPLFTGKLIDSYLQITFPSDYTLLYGYMQNSDKNQRVMVLPQSSYWSWKLYNFHYRGSGFMWFGIPQPLLDRAFDPWSNTNENYYWELSRALYSKDTAGVDMVMRKYDIQYILLDEYITTPNNARSLFVDEIRELLGPPTKTFGKLSLWERLSTTNNFVRLAHNLPTVNPYSWADNDVAYSQLGDYITENGNITYPFRSLFTKRSVNDREFAISETAETITIGSIVESTGASILKSDTIVYDSTVSGDLNPAAVKPCGLLKQGTATARTDNGTLVFESRSKRGCLSFDIPNLSHKYGYIAVVENRHLSGRPMMISFINDTAKHVEVETYLPANKQISASYFVLPPLAPDGMGYTIYLSNDSIGNEPTVNEISQIRIYTMPYNEMVQQKIRNNVTMQQYNNSSFTVSHPNPSLYTVTTMDTGTLILSQSYDSGWIAWSNGKILPHVLVNNWSNGWILGPGTNGTIYIFFWPQLLQFLGFILIPVPFVWIARKFSLQ